MKLLSSLGITGLCHKAGILLLNAWHVLLFFQLATQIQPAPGSTYPEDGEKGEENIKFFLEALKTKQSSVCGALHLGPLVQPT